MRNLRIYGETRDNFTFWRWLVELAISGNDSLQKFVPINNSIRIFVKALESDIGQISEIFLLFLVFRINLDVLLEESQEIVKVDLVSFSSVDSPKSLDSIKLSALDQNLSGELYLSFHL